MGWINIQSHNSMEIAELALSDHLAKGVKALAA